MMFKTADLCDQYPDEVQVAEPILHDYGGVRTFGGPIATVQVFDDNVLVRAALEQPGAGRVLVVDGGGSLRCALVGDVVAGLAVRNGWAGLLVFGCVRDTEALAGMPIGIKAVNSTPLRSEKAGIGQADVTVTFGEVTFIPGRYVYADADGVVVAERDLLSAAAAQAAGAEVTGAQAAAGEPGHAA